MHQVDPGSAGRVGWSGQVGSGRKFLGRVGSKVFWIWSGRVSRPGSGRVPTLDAVKPKFDSIKLFFSDIQKRDELISTGLRIGLRVYKLEPCVNVKQCLKCKKLTHTESKCTNEKTCARCSIVGDNHQLAKTPSSAQTVAKATQHLIVLSRLYKSKKSPNRESQPDFNSVKFKPPKKYSKTSRKTS